MPAVAVLPTPPLMLALLLPLEEQDTSYFAESERILILSRISMKNTTYLRIL